jgi:hypothetical protein
MIVVVIEEMGRQEHIRKRSEQRKPFLVLQKMTLFMLNN